MKDLSDEQRRAELGEFFRSHRERLTPDMFGMDFGTRRRTPGLRREEVAQLCGVSATWYTWIEQGRDVSVSPAALGRMAAALRLSRAERGYLFALAGKRAPEADPAEVGQALPPGLTAVTNGIALPAYVLDR